jgi:glyoxylase-like metal-dependent hydrolase (beta-lactamase superfamily II)
MKPTVLQIAVGQMANFTYIVADEENGEAAVIDPSWDLDKIFQTLKKNNWQAKYIINTHTHFDHVIGNEQMAGYGFCTHPVTLRTASASYLMINSF